MVTPFTYVSSMLAASAVTLTPAAIDPSVRVYVATFLISLWLFYAGKVLAYRMRDGRAPMNPGAVGSPERLRRRLFQAAQILLPIGAFARALDPSLDVYAGPFRALETATLMLAGVALSLAGFMLTVFSHSYMGALWRSGLPDGAALEKGPDALLQSGPFAVSRNPIYLGVMMMQLGVFLAWPALLTAASLAAGVVALSGQARAEERDLRARFGASYDAYCARTPRWLFG